MLLFAATGITLNHASQIKSRPDVVSREAELPPILAEALRVAAAGKSSRSRDVLPGATAAWLRTHLQVDVRKAEGEWSADEVVVSMPRPGGDAWLRIALPDGRVEYEATDRGWISYLNDLHKGRNTGVAWSWFIDIFAVAAMVFCITGFLIMKLHAANRPLTWPVLGLGVVLPLVLLLVFAH